MKKLISLILAVLMLLSFFCGCAANSDNTDQTPTETTAAPVKTLSAEEAVQIYLDNKDIWETKTDDTTWYGYMFFDLNFDGTLELVAATNAGTGFYSDNKYYALDEETKTVKELTFPDKDEENQWDFTGGDYPKVYRNNETNQLKYMVYDHVRAGAGAYGMCIGELYLDEDMNVISRNLWSFDYIADPEQEGEAQNIFRVYDANGQSEKVEEEAYNNTLSTYESSNTLLEMTYEIVEQVNTEYTYSELTAEEKYDLFLSSYKAFSYK